MPKSKFLVGVARRLVKTTKISVKIQSKRMKHGAPSTTATENIPEGIYLHEGSCYRTL